MFAVVTAEEAIIDNDKKLSVPASLCLFMFNTSLNLGFQAAYNAMGYALLASNPLMTPALTMTAAVQSGVIGVAVMAPINCAISVCCIPAKRPDPGLTGSVGFCCEPLNAVIYSLIGAQVQGLFATTTTPAYIAAGAATGAAVGIAGTVATILVIGGLTYCCVTLNDNRAALIPTSCMPNFKCKDLVYPCQVGLDICTGEQMQAFLQSCVKCCSKTRATPTGAPISLDMTRGNDAHDPVLHIRQSQIPVAIMVDETPTQSSTPAIATTLETNNIPIITATSIESTTAESNKLAMT